MGTRHWPEDAQVECGRLEDEIAKLRAEVAKLALSLADIGNDNTRLSAEIARLRAEVEEARADRDRLDWLDATDYEGEARLTLLERTWWKKDSGSIRATIDAARQEGGE